MEERRASAGITDSGPARSRLRRESFIGTSTARASRSFCSQPLNRVLTLIIAATVPDHGFLANGADITAVTSVEMQNERPFPAVVHLVGIVILSTTLLAIGLERAGAASPFSDPVSRIRAQDESNYVSGAVHLATEGGWLTPKVLGRYFLYKPPLLVWLAGLSMKLFGIALWAVRLPALAAAVFATTVLFWWTHAARSAVVAWSTALLLLSDPLWHIFTRLCYTDMLLVASTTGAVASLYGDRTLSRTSSFWGFALCTAAGVMAKNVSGGLPVLVVLLYCVLAPKNERPRLSRIASNRGSARAHDLYQIFVHPKWFWADYVEVQLLGSGISPPGQMSGDGPVWFYLRRLRYVRRVFYSSTAYAASRSAIALLIFATRTDFAMPRNMRILI
ncbi:MAG: hypothetical protein DMG57_22280 [Acidobacteria bacterium]|nr:MAG: hypothetical protein DMG57_22280 [Acidobacteriota bacterium]